MTVSATGRIYSYSGNGITTIFSFPRPFEENSDLKVYTIDAATKVETLKTYSTHYSVTGAGDDAGGTVVFLTAPAIGTTVVIYADTPATQNLDLDNVTSFPLASVEAAHDRATVEVQELQDRVERALASPRQRNPGLDHTLPIAVPGGVFAISDDGASIVLLDPGDLTGTPVSPPDDWWDVYGIVGDGVTDDLVAMNALIAAINAGTASGTFEIPEGFDIAFSAPLDPITRGGWRFVSAGDIEVAFSLLEGSGTHGRLFKIGVYGGTRVSDWGFINVGLYNENWAVDDGTEWQLEIENATAGVLRGFHADGGLGIRNGYKGMRGDTEYDGVSIRANRALPGPALFFCSGTSKRGSFVGVQTVGFNLITNASFNTTDGWTVSDAVAVAGMGSGTLTVHCTGSAANITQTFPIAPLVGTTYSVTVILTNYVAGSLTVQLTGGVTQSGTPITANTTARGVVVNVTAVSGNTSLRLLFSADANFKVASAVPEREVSSDFTPVWFGGVYNDGTLWDNIDAVKWDRLTVNQARGNLIEHAVIIEYGIGQIGSLNFFQPYGELAGGDQDDDEDGSTIGSPWLITDASGTTGRIRGFYCKSPRATTQLGNTIPSMQIVAVNGNEISHVEFTGGTFAMARDAAIKITSTDPTQKIDVLLDGVSFVDRSLEAGSPHNVIEVGANGLRVIDCKLHISYKGPTFPGEVYNSNISKFLVATADLTSLEVRGNKIVDCIDVPCIDITALTDSFGDGIIIEDNVGCTITRNPSKPAIIRQFAAAGDGVTDDTDAINDMLDRGLPLKLEGDKSYLISSSILIGNDDAIIDGQGAEIIMSMAGGAFDNTTSGSANRYLADAIGFYALNVDHPTIRSLRIRTSALTEDRYVSALAVRGCSEITIEGIEASGFSKPTRIISVDGAVSGLISGNYVHDCYTNSATTGQITGIGIDTDVNENGIGATNSDGLIIVNNRVERLQLGATFLAIGGSNNWQSTGIHVASTSLATRKGRGFVVSGNYIDDCGQGIDFYCNDSVISGNTINNCHSYGIPLKHGASRNTITGNNIRYAGRFAIGLFSEDSNNFTQDTADNLIHGNRIFGIDPDGLWSATSGGIYIPLNDGGTYLARRNKIWNNDIDLNSTGKYGVLAEAGAGTLNEVLDNRVINYATAEYSLDSTVVPYFRKFLEPEQMDIYGRELSTLDAAQYIADFETTKVWTNNIGGGTAVRTVAAAALTGTYITVFSATNATRWEWQDFMPYDSTKLYKITFRARRNSGTTGNFNLGVIGYKADRTTRVSTAGTNTYASAHYVAVQGSAQTGIGSGWTEFTGYFTGTSGAPSGAPGTLASPAALHTDVRFVTPHIILNNATGDCQIDIDSVRIEIVPTQQILETFIFPVGDETTALTTGTAKYTRRMPYAFTVTDVRASVNTAPTGGTLLTVDVNEAGTSIISTKLTFDASEKTTTTAATPRVISDSSLADDAEISIDIDAVGSTIAGAGLKVYLIGYRT